MDFPQQPQGATPFPSAPQSTTPPPFPNVPTSPVMPDAMPTPTGAPMMPPAGPMPGATMPPLGSSGMNPMGGSVQIPVQSHPATLSSSDEQVYTMPEKFLAPTAPAAAARARKKPSKAITIVLIVVIALMILGAIGGVLYYFLVLAKQAPVETNANNAVVVNNTNNANTVPNANNTNVDGNTNNANGNVNNTNVNSNANTNANDNTNVANSNTNSNVNNANSNVNNVNTNANTNTSGAVPPAAKDTDEDKLTNDEEAIWSTKADLPDTDSDGYADGVEVLAGYDPTSATGKLAASALVGTFANSEYSYSMLYPKDWLAEALAEGDASEVLITPNTQSLSGQFVAVTVTANPTGLTAIDWYTDTANVDEEDVEALTSLSGLQGVWSTDRTTVYYADSNYVYALSYRFGNSDELYFPSTFELMVKSFAITASN